MANTKQENKPNPEEYEGLAEMMVNSGIPLPTEEELNNWANSAVDLAVELSKDKR